MPDSRRTSALKLEASMRQLSEAFALAVLRSIPLIGPQIAINRELVARISALFQNDDAIKADVNKIMNNMAEIEEMVPLLKVHLETRRADLERTLEEYERFRSLAAVEKENVQPLLKELHRNEKKNLILGLIISLIMIFIGIVLAHFLRIWFPGFTF
jgi:hypothetical protein